MTDDAVEDPSPDAAEAPKKKSDLLPRLVTAVIGIPALLAVIFLAPTWAFALVVLAACVIAAWEYMSMVGGSTQRAGQLVTAAATGAVASVLYLTSTPSFGADGTMLALTFAAGALGIFLTFLFTYKDLEKVSLLAGSGAMAMVYCGIMPGLMALLQRDGGEDGGYWILMAFAVVWGSDTGAYFSGRAFGKHKLAPRVSPKKTVEGAVGGLLASVTAVVIFKLTALPELAWWQVFALAVPANILGQTGDLCESLIKRAHGVKDSGIIIYGHGGMLDRIDALIFALPWFYFFQHYLFR